MRASRLPPTAQSRLRCHRQAHRQREAPDPRRPQPWTRAARQRSRERSEPRCVSRRRPYPGPPRGETRRRQSSHPLRESPTGPEQLHATSADPRNADSPTRGRASPVRSGARGRRTRRRHRGPPVHPQCGVRSRESSASLSPTVPRRIRWQLPPPETGTTSSRGRAEPAGV